LFEVTMRMSPWRWVKIGLIGEVSFEAADCSVFT
jgi:hypothetical protein